MKFAFTVFLDVLFFLFLSFSLSFAVLNFFVDRPFSIVFSAVFAALFSLIATRKMIDNFVKTRLKKQEKEELDDMLIQFNFSTKTDNNDLFEKLINRLGYQTERKKGGIFLTEKTAAVFVAFGFNDVGKSEIVKVFNSIRKNDVAYILSETFSQDVTSFAARFMGRIILVDGKTVYTSLKSHDALPEKKYAITPEKQHGLKLFRNLLLKRKAKSYLTFGLIFLFTSYFMPIKLYYVIFGCVFLIAALFCKLFGIKETEENF